MENLYEFFGIPTNATGAQIKFAYRNLSKQHHPDSGGNEELFRKVQEAYEILSNEDRRAYYDRQECIRLAQEEEKKHRARIEAIDDITKLEMLLGFSVGSKAMRPSFAYSLLQQVSNGRMLSEKQKQAINNIVENFKLDLDVWLVDSFRHDRLNIFLSSIEEVPPTSFSHRENDF